jgi:hypothetical protein
VELELEFDWKEDELVLVKRACDRPRVGERMPATGLPPPPLLLLRCATGSVLKEGLLCGDERPCSRYVAIWFWLVLPALPSSNDNAPSSTGSSRSGSGSVGKGMCAVSATRCGAGGCNDTDNGEPTKEPLPRLLLLHVPLPRLLPAAGISIGLPPPSSGLPIAGIAAIECVRRPDMFRCGAHCGPVKSAEAVQHSARL